MKIIHFKRFKQSLKIALLGIGYALKKEENFRLMFFGAIIALIFAFWLPLSLTERALIFLTITTVLGMELINAQIERVLNIIQPQFDIRVKRIKDLSAAAVLIAVIGSIIVGIIIFLPKLMKIIF